MSNYKVVYQIVERKGQPPFWSRIGVAWVNKDGSLNVALNSLPVDGKMHIRDPSPTEAAQRVVSSFGPPAKGEPYPDEEVPFK